MVSTHTARSWSRSGGRPASARRCDRWSGSPAHRAWSSSPTTTPPAAARPHWRRSPGRVASRPWSWTRTADRLVAGRRRWSGRSSTTTAANGCWSWTTTTPSTTGSSWNGSSRPDAGRARPPSVSEAPIWCVRGPSSAAGDLPRAPRRRSTTSPATARLSTGGGRSDTCGGFDAGLFFGFEDLDLGLRLRAAGERLIVIELGSLHQVADTAANRSPWREYYKARALTTIARRHLGRVATACTVARLGGGGLFLAVRERHGLQLLRARLRGIAHAFSGVRGPGPYRPSINPAKSPSAAPSASRRASA